MQNKTPTTKKIKKKGNEGKKRPIFSGVKPWLEDDLMKKDRDLRTMNLNKYLNDRSKGKCFKEEVMNCDLDGLLRDEELNGMVINGNQEVVKTIEPEKQVLNVLKSNHKRSSGEIEGNQRKSKQDVSDIMNTLQGLLNHYQNIYNNLDQYEEKECEQILKTILQHQKEILDLGPVSKKSKNNPTNNLKYENQVKEIPKVIEKDAFDQLVQNISDEESDSDSDSSKEVKEKNKAKLMKKDKIIEIEDESVADSDSDNDSRSEENIVKSREIVQISTSDSSSGSSDSEESSCEQNDSLERNNIKLKQAIENNKTQTASDINNQIKSNEIGNMNEQHRIIGEDEFILNEIDCINNMIPSTNKTNINEVQPIKKELTRILNSILPSMIKQVRKNYLLSMYNKQNFLDSIPCEHIDNGELNRILVFDAHKSVKMEESAKVLAKSVIIEELYKKEEKTCYSPPRALSPSGYEGDFQD